VLREDDWSWHDGLLHATIKGPYVSECREGEWGATGLRLGHYR